MAMNPRLLRPTANDSPASIPGLALWLDASAPDALYTTDAGPVTAVSSPLDISGCVGWWDASDASSISDTSGSVDQWSDKSGQGNHVTASTTARPTTGTRTLNGLNVLDFDGTNDVLALGGYTFSSIATSRAMSVFCVMASDDPNAVRRVMSLQRTGKNSNDTGVFIGRHTTSSGSIDFATGAGDSATNDQADKNLISIFTDTSSSAGLYGFTVSAASNAKAMFKSGAAPATTVRFGTMAASSFLSEGSGGHTIDIGASRNSGNTLAAFWDGYIAEIIVYNTALSTSDRARVEAYLANKWGISNVHAPAVTASDPVGYWRDRSGNGRHATQSTAASRPVVGTQNGRRALTFDGTNDNLNNTPTATVGADAVTFIAAVKHNLTSQPSYLSMPVDMSEGNAGRPITRWQQNNSLNRMYLGTTFNAVTSSYRSQPERFVHCIDGRKDNGGSGIHTLREFFDGAQVASVDITATWTTTGQKFNIGSRDDNGTQYKGDICELLIYSRALSTAERRKVERYLARRWGITLAPQVGNAEAQDWINRVYAAGSTVSQPVANAVSAFVDGCQADGIWDAMKSVVLLAGADTLAGALVPLVGTAPTNNNFTASDYNRETGLVGDGSTTYLDSNRASNADPLNDFHAAVYASTASTATNDYIGVNEPGVTGTIEITQGSDMFFRSRENTGFTATGSGSQTGFIGMSRDNGSDYDYRFGGNTATAVRSSVAATSLTTGVFARNRGGFRDLFSDGRLAFYSLGEALDLQALDTRVSALIAAIGNAL